MGQIIEVIQRYEMPEIPQIELPEEDGELLETSWHRNQMNLLIDVVRYRWRERQDFYAGGNMFIYYSLKQARNRDYKGPDFFVVKGIDGRSPRQKWVVWEEDGRYPNVIIELMSPSTKEEDLGRKKELYERIFHTGDYFCYDPDQQQTLGWTLEKMKYEALLPDENGRLWSHELDGWLGVWEGVYQSEPGVWLRLFDEYGQLIPTAAEAEGQRAAAALQRAEAERQRAEAERQRAEAAEAELAQLKARLAQLEQGRDSA